ncbi:MAG: hypothetical protein MK213_10490 [Planctomycetes bacterium]|nr:hypothetical protein [Planctomycetota bacterium]
MIGVRLFLPVFLTFCCGFLAGFMVADQNPDREHTNLAPDLIAYERGLSATTDLDSDQRADLRVLLAYYQRERDALLHTQRALMEPQLADLDARFERLIMDHILDPDQKEFASLPQEPSLVFPQQASSR